MIAVSEAYARATMTTREELLGRGLFELFPDNQRGGLERLAVALATSWVHASAWKQLSGRASGGVDGL